MGGEVYREVGSTGRRGLQGGGVYTGGLYRGGGDLGPHLTELWVLHGSQDGHPGHYGELI